MIRSLILPSWKKPHPYQIIRATILCTMLLPTKTRRGILLALEQAGVAYIPASQRYIVYEHQKPLIALFRDLLHRD